MKKIITLCAIACLMAACGENKSTQPKSNGLPKAGDAKTAAADAGRVAYVEVDSLITQLEMCKEAKAALEAKAKSYEQQIGAKSSAFQKAYQAHAQKMQTTGYASQDEFEKAQQRLQKMQEEGAKFEMQLHEKMQLEEATFNERLRDSVRAYIAVVNADHRYSMILSKSGDNVLYADPSLDITDEVIKGMNKRYKK